MLTMALNAMGPGQAAASARQGVKSYVAYSRELNDHVVVPVLAAAVRPRYGPPRRRDYNPRYRQILCYRPTEKERYARDLLLTSCARGPGGVSRYGQRSGRAAFGVRIVADVC